MDPADRLQVSSRRSAAVKYVVVCLFLAFAVAIGRADGAEPIQPTAEDKCPVCGMFTARYSNFVAEIIFKDDSYVTFDGPKDMFKYYLNLETFAKGRTKTEVDSIYVTEYYGLVLIDARQAYFVTGSDVHGPMGHELIAFSNREDAEVFKKDHRGTALLEFGEVTAALITSLGRMR